MSNAATEVAGVRIIKPQWCGHTPIGSAKSLQEKTASGTNMGTNKQKFIERTGAPVSQQKHIAIVSVDVRHDGQVFATGGFDHKVRIWTTQAISPDFDHSKAELACLNHEDTGGSTISCVRWSKSGALLATCDENGLYLWHQLSTGNAGSGRNSSDSQGPFYEMKYAAAFGAADGLGGADDYDTDNGFDSVHSSETFSHRQRWEMARRIEVGQKDGHSLDITGLCWAPDDKYIATSSLDTSVCIWNQEKSSLFKKLQGGGRSGSSSTGGHTGRVHAVAWDPSGRTLATQGEDGVRIWNADTWVLEKEITEPFKQYSSTSLIWRLTWAPLGDFLAVPHSSARHPNSSERKAPAAIILDRQRDWTIAIDYHGHSKPVTVAAFSRRMTTTQGDSGIYDTRHPHRDTLQYLCATGSQDGGLIVWTTRQNRPLLILTRVFQGAVCDISWSHDSQGLIACSEDGCVAVVQLPETMVGMPVDEEYFREEMHNQASSSRQDNRGSRANVSVGREDVTLPHVAAIQIDVTRGAADLIEVPRTVANAVLPTIDVDNSAAASRSGRTRVQPLSLDGEHEDTGVRRRTRIAPISLDEMPPEGEQQLLQPDTQQTKLSLQNHIEPQGVNAETPLDGHKGPDLTTRPLDEQLVGTAKPKKPLTAYLMFANENRDRVRQEKPECTMQEINRELGLRWASLSEVDKSKFHSAADPDLEKWRASMRAWQRANPDVPDIPIKRVASSDKYPSKASKRSKTEGRFADTLNEVFEDAARFDADELENEDDLPEEVDFDPIAESSEFDFEEDNVFDGYSGEPTSKVAFAEFLHNHRRSKTRQGFVLSLPSILPENLRDVRRTVITDQSIKLSIEYWTAISSTDDGDQRVCGIVRAVHAKELWRREYRGEVVSFACSNSRFACIFMSDGTLNVLDASSGSLVSSPICLADEVVTGSVTRASELHGCLQNLLMCVLRSGDVRVIDLNVLRENRLPDNSKGWHARLKHIRALCGASISLPQSIMRSGAPMHAGILLLEPDDASRSHVDRLDAVVMPCIVTRRGEVYVFDVRPGLRSWLRIVDQRNVLSDFVDGLALSETQHAFGRFGVLSVVLETAAMAAGKHKLLMAGAEGNSHSALDVFSRMLQEFQHQANVTAEAEAAFQAKSRGPSHAASAGFDTESAKEKARYDAALLDSIHHTEMCVHASITLRSTLALKYWLRLYTQKCAQALERGELRIRSLFHWLRSSGGEFGREWSGYACDSGGAAGPIPEVAGTVCGLNKRTLLREVVLEKLKEVDGCQQLFEELSLDLDAVERQSLDEGLTEADAADDAGMLDASFRA